MSGYFLDMQIPSRLDWVELQFFSEAVLCEKYKPEHQLSQQIWGETHLTHLKLDRRIL